jgi:signal transduction histidine kinase
VTNARAYGAQRTRRDELERGKNAYEATLEISKALAGETDLDVVLELVVKRGRALVRARSVLIGLVEDDEVVVVTAAGQLDRSVTGRRLPLEGSLAGRTIRQGASQRYSGLADSLSFTLREETGADCGLFVPLLLRGRAIGVLAAFDRLEDGPQFGVEDERLMEAFATSAANAVATAQTVAVEGVQRAMHAAEQERRRWARELHDDTLQEIGALRVLLGGAMQTGDADHVAEAVTLAVERLASQANVLRAMITDLHPAALDKLGLAAAIEALIDRARDREGLDVSLTVDLSPGEGRLAPDTELAAYRFVQEALTNVVRHAGAASVEIDVHEADDHLALRVTNDGHGFDPDADAPGFGLLGMRERVGLSGGRVSVESAVGEGTTIRAGLPAVHVDPGPSVAELSA